MKKIFISSDHAGFKLKEDIKNHLKKKKLNIEDLGPINDNRVDYPDYAHKVAKKVKESKKVSFWEVIDPEVSWDFLIGIFLSVFKREKWEKHKSILDSDQIKDSRYWSNTDNTLIHPKIMCSAFRDSPAYICADPLSVNLQGEREWSDLYEFIEIARLPELLDFYRSKGMSFKRYLFCKNFALRNFSNYLIKIILGGQKKGLNYINFKKHIFNNLLFPNVYFSLIRSTANKIFKYVKK